MGEPLDYRKRTLVRFARSVLPVALLLPLLLVLLMVAVIDSEKIFVDRDNLHKNVITAIKNGATLEDVKQIFENRKYDKRLSKLFRSLLSGENPINPEEFYKEPINLTTVLKDIKSEIYLGETVDLDLANSISKTIEDHEKTNPFDKLEPGQRIHFELVQAKLGEKYMPIQEDIVRIVDEIDNKNKLVKMYFSEATMSFRISVFALIIGLLALLPQIASLWRWWKARVVGGPNNKGT